MHKGVQAYKNGALGTKRTEDIFPANIVQAIYASVTKFRGRNNERYVLTSRRLFKDKSWTTFQLMYNLLFLNARRVFIIKVKHRFIIIHLEINYEISR